MSLFTMLMTIPQVLTIWLGHQAAGGFAVIVERYGIQKHDKNIDLPCVGWRVLDSAVIIGVVIYG